MRIADIHVGYRHRRELGDVQALADSIERCGLLHPPVVTTDMELVCGLRRLEAAKRLGWTEIEVRTIDPEDMLAAEHDENEVRKAFTPSERVAIAGAIEKLLGNRQGKRISGGEPRENIPEVARGRRTAEVAAARAGFGNRRTYEQASDVVNNGATALVEAMDRGDVSISAAAAVAKLPASEQEAIAAAGPKAVREKAAEIRQGRSRVNGVVTNDPPDVAAARANGRIAPDVVVEVTEPEPAAEDPAAGPAETDEAALDDQAWLAALPLHAKLEGDCLKAFCKDALYYRHVEPARKTFQHHARRAPGAATQHGPYAYRTKRWLRTDHPKHWLLCPTTENEGCGGGGQIPLIGQCPKCRGKGYWIK
jgi:ParB-like chromosome segregation protein Spo0J